jgi:hypothetical protein
MTNGQLFKQLLAYFPYFLDKQVKMWNVLN